MSKTSEIYFRPDCLKDYKGQEKIKKALSFYIKSAKMRHDCLDHIIIYGNSGLGKTTLANIIVNEMEARLVSVSAPSIKTVQEMADILMNLERHSILFIDEIHRLPKKIEEVLYFAMEDFMLETEIDGLKERLEMSPFTLIGATTMMGMLSEPLRNRFQITLELTPYKKESLMDIIKASIEKMEGEIDDNCAEMVARRSRGIPRIANGFIRRIRDFAMVLNEGKINKEVVEETFDFLEIDENGLTAQDRRYLTTLVKKFGRKAVGIDTICSILNDDKRTIETVVEPYLIQKGFIVKTPRGRIVVEDAIRMVKEWEGR
jgi:Holliday junction DNA helicase RuvB